MQPSGVHLGNFKKLSVMAPSSKSVHCNSSQYEGRADTPHFTKLIPIKDILGSEERGEMIYPRSELRRRQDWHPGI